MLGFSEALHLELRPENIRVSCVLPGRVSTDFLPASRRRSGTFRPATWPKRSWMCWPFIREPQRVVIEFATGPPAGMRTKTMAEHLSEGRETRRVALVTGAAQGIGFAIARKLAAEGAAIAIADVQLEAGEAAAQKLRDAGGTVRFILADMSKEASIGEDAASLPAYRCSVGLNILVNNAGPAQRVRVPFDQQTSTAWDETQALMLRGYLIVSQAATEPLAAGGGAIVNLSSVLARSISHESAAYHVAKAGVEHLTRYLAANLGRRGIRVNAVAPGIVDRETPPKLSDSPENRAVIDVAVPLGRAASGDDIADAVSFLCGPSAAYITGQVLVVDGGLSLGEPFGVARAAIRSAERQEVIVDAWRWRWRLP